MIKKNVSATELAKLGKCEKMSVLDKISPKVISSEVLDRMEEGNRAHVKIERQIISDERCFIASYAYGNTDERTNFLRWWRDEYLMHSFLGNVCVLFYYRVSPFIVRCCKSSPYVERAIRKILDAIVVYLGYKDPKEH